MGRLWLGFSLLAALIAVPYVLVTGVLMGLGYLPDWNLGRTVKPAIAVMVVPAVFVLLYPVFLLDTGNRNAGNSA
jgi:fumarate reductase subunit D